MKPRLNYRAVVWTTFVAIAVLSLTVGAGAVSGVKTIKLLDDCDPVSFNEAFGEGQCIGNGRTTVDEFFEELEEDQTVHRWRNRPLKTKLKVGRATEIQNVGGELHTFTRVAEFGGGFLEDLNELSGNPIPAPECLIFNNLFPVRAGFTRVGPVAGSPQLPVGKTKFQCCIHPWMRTVIEVRAKKKGDNDNDFDDEDEN